MISYHCDIKDLELSIGVRHVTSTMLKVVGKTGTIFFFLYSTNFVVDGDAYYTAVLTIHKTLL